MATPPPSQVNTTRLHLRGHLLYSQGSLKSNTAQAVQTRHPHGAGRYNRGRHLCPCTATGAQVGCPDVFQKTLDIHTWAPEWNHICVPGRGDSLLSSPALDEPHTLESEHLNLEPNPTINQQSATVWQQDSHFGLLSSPVNEVFQEHSSSELFSVIHEDELNLNYTQKCPFFSAEGEDVTSQEKRNPTEDAHIPRDDHSISQDKHEQCLTKLTHCCLSSLLPWVYRLLFFPLVSSIPLSI